MVKRFFFVHHHYNKSWGPKWKEGPLLRTIVINHQVFSPNQSDWLCGRGQPSKLRIGDKRQKFRGRGRAKNVPKCLVKGNAFNIIIDCFYGIVLFKALLNFLSLPFLLHWLCLSVGLSVCLSFNVIAQIEPSAAAWMGLGKKSWFFSAAKQKMDNMKWMLFEEKKKPNPIKEILFNISWRRHVHVHSNARRRAGWLRSLERPIGLENIFSNKKTRTTTYEDDDEKWVRHQERLSLRDG